MKSEQVQPQRANRLALYYILVSIAIGIAGSFANHAMGAINTDIPYLISLIVLGSFVIWLSRTSRQYVPAALGFRGFSWGSTVSLFIWISITGEGITAFVLAWFPEPMIEILLTAFTPETLLSWCLFLIMAAIIAPIGEEIVFRGFILNSYARSAGAHHAVWLSAMLFGLAHHSPPHVLAAFVSGLVFARFVIAGGSLWSSIAAHALVNFSSTAMMHFNHSPLIFPDYEATRTGGAIGLIIAVTATTLFFHFHPVILNQPIKKQSVISIALVAYLLITMTLLFLDLLPTLLQPSVVIPAH